MQKIIIAGVFASLIASVSPQVFAQQDVVEKRQKAMKSNSADVKAIKAAIAEKDYATVQTKAKEIMGTADKIPSLFPKGSDVGKTKATPAIWEKSDEFAKAAKNLSKASSELASAAQSKDDAAVAAKFKAVGEACSSCHKEFRADKYSE
ncbi:MAG TPA: cytochrome c [Gammaproteobacteria bacterium]|nr:cytochrome c [Gammaproteobacteria bacterium]